MPSTARDGGIYRVSTAQKAAFERDGWVHLPGVLAPDEVAALATDYDRFLRGEITVAGKDFCDMSGDYTKTVEQFSIINVMLPRRYHPAWQGNVYEQRAASIAEQLCGAGMALDYDQLLAKRPQRDDAVFGWHQDLAYWPTDTPDLRTATCWLAIDDSTAENGCMRFVSGSHLVPLRPHRPLHGDRGKSHTLVTDLVKGDRVTLAEIARGDVTVHNERVLHGSGGNKSAGWRRAYIVAFRSAATVAEERRRGFTHSHNDAAKVLGSVGFARKK
ncbi:MAG: phytanoyl-CoA dioxygenase family protein [Planctomycetes bacterium]|nr:phytanoyl-CoA dioxygenase family protein [Planctomycetota bacterium]